MSARRLIMLGLVLVAALGWGWWSSLRRAAEPQRPLIIDKQPPTVATRTFDPLRPLAGMPPLRAGEEAVCDSNFISSASVSGVARQPDGTHAIVTITKVRVTLGLDITMWVPAGVRQHVIEHEDGHRQISEHYYETADQLAERIALPYLGREATIADADLDAEMNRVLRETGAAITEEYSRKLNPEPAQLRYDAITDHGRNEIAATDAVRHALDDMALRFTPSSVAPGN